MNIFMMILMTVFMVGYYLIASPSVRIAEQETQYAVSMADTRYIAECAVSAHNATLTGRTFDDVCVQQNGITSKTLCADKKLNIVDCSAGGKNGATVSYIVTTTAPLAAEKYSDMLDILEKYYSDSGAFGIYEDGFIITGNVGNKVVAPKSIVGNMEIKNDQLVYITQYRITAAKTEYVAPDIPDVVCPSGTVKTFRFGRWQCVEANTDTDCGGDKIWDSDLLTCVVDETRKPLCGATQTAVLIDDVWECLNPYPDINCSAGMIARLNYETLLWECVNDPNVTTANTKCSTKSYRLVRGPHGVSVRRDNTTCTSCEKMVTDEETCDAKCVPDDTKLVDNSECYPGSVNACNNSTQAIYFGFPDETYIQNAAIDVLTDSPVLDSEHNTNRLFNCMVCETGVDTERSVWPYTVVCK